MSELPRYATGDSCSQTRLHANQKTGRLTQLDMAKLFDAGKQNISMHLGRIFQDGKLAQAANVKQSLTVQAEGGRKAQLSAAHYNLDVILAVGCHQVTWTKGKAAS